MSSHRGFTYWHDGVRYWIRAKRDLLSRARRDDLVLTPIWYLQFHILRLRLAVELATAAKAGNVEAAQKLVGPIVDAENLPLVHEADRQLAVRDSLYDHWLDCGRPSLDPRSEPAKPCPMAEACPKPDTREDGGFQKCAETYGPCGQRGPLSPAEYLMAVQQSVADMLSANSWLSTRTVFVEAVFSTDLAEAVRSEFHSPTRSGYAEHMRRRWGEHSLEFLNRDLDWMLQHTTNTASTLRLARAPLFQFHRVVRGSWAWPGTSCLIS